MPKIYKGDDIVNSVIELNLRDTALNLGTPTVVVKHTGENKIDQIVGNISDNLYKGPLSNKIKGLHIGTSCTAIGESSFENSDYLTGALVIPRSVTSIGRRAFYNCTEITGSLTIPSSVTNIGDFAFYNCSNITKVEFYSTTAPTIGVSTFDNLTSLSTGEVHVPVGTKAIYEAAYDWVNNTPSLTIVDDL